MNYSGAGNQVNEAALTGATEMGTWDFLREVDVMAGEGTPVIVTFGDSITDGTGSTENANARWANVLAARLQANGQTAGMGVVDEGIAGNRLLNPASEVSGLLRFDRDVLSVAGIRYVIILLGINDIGGSQKRDPTHPTTAAELVTGLTSLIEKAHAKGVKVIGATLTPYRGAMYYNEPGEMVREAENDWIRHGGKFDGVIDFAAMTADPRDPKAYAVTVGSRDHLHPGDGGYKMMGDGIDLKLFK